MLDQRAPDLAIEDVDAAMRRLLPGDGAGKMVCAQIESGGSRVRAALGLDAARCLGLSPESAIAIAACCELLHTASLLHDDVQDGTRNRRDRPAAWSIHGTSAAICAGDMALSAAYAAAAGLGAQTGAAIRLVHAAIARTIEGQSLDLNAGCAPSLVDYEQIAIAKSAPLLRLPFELSLCAANLPMPGVLGRITDGIALAYQITDDITDIVEDRAADAPNACLALAATGLTATQSRATAAHWATDALNNAQSDLDRLPVDLRPVLPPLIERLRHKIEEIHDAP